MTDKRSVRWGPTIGLAAAALSFVAIVMILLFAIVPALRWDAATAKCGSYLSGDGTYSIRWIVDPLPHFLCTYQPEGQSPVTVDIG